MSYTIKIPITQYKNWTIPSEQRLEEYFNSIPEVLESHFDWRTDTRDFTFESEQHYHWFLLKVT